MYRPCIEPQFYVLERPVYKLGELIDFSSGGRGGVFKGLGWSKAEPWGTWSDGTEACLTFKLEHPASGGLVIKAEAQAFVAPQHPSQTVGVVVNGTQVTEWYFDLDSSRGTRTATILGGIVGQENLEIVFEIPQAVSPAELKLSSDVRRVGLGLIKLQIIWTEPSE
jgi:hypothetical protein